MNLFSHTTETIQRAATIEHARNALRALGLSRQDIQRQHAALEMIAHGEWTENYVIVMEGYRIIQHLIARDGRLPDDPREWVQQVLSAFEGVVVTTESRVMLERTAIFGRWLAAVRLAWSAEGTPATVPEGGDGR